jgi:PucR family transcriptional regulator, purine catabolism regulatory protein
MPWSVGSMIQTPGLGLRLLIAGDLDLPVRWIHTTEIPDPSLWLEGGEVILTAGVWLDAGVKPTDFVSRLVKARVVAMGFGVVHERAFTPVAIVNECRRHGLTLFEVPVETPFLALTKMFVEILAVEREAPLKAALRRNQEFTRAVNQGASFGGILKVLERSVGYSCLIAGTRLTAQSAPQRIKPQVFDDLWQRARKSRGRQFQFETLQAFPIVVAGRIEACLAADTDGNQLDMEQRAAIDQALNFVGLELARTRALREGERRFAVELVDLLVEGQEHADAVFARLPDFGIDPTRPLLAAVCRIPVKDRDRYLNAVEDTMQELNNSALFAAKGDRIIVVTESDEAPDNLRAVGSRLAEAIGPEGYVGVGSVARNSLDLRRSLIEADYISRFAEHRRLAERYATHQEVGSHRLLLALLDLAIVSTYKRAVLQPLIDYDLEHKVQLVDTLRAFLKSGQQWANTARKLGIHVNTLRHRLLRVEELTGRHLSSVEDLVDLYVALNAGAQLSP